MLLLVNWVMGSYIYACAATTVMCVLRVVFDWFLECWAVVISVTQSLTSYTFAGCKLLEHQESAGPDMPDCCGHDQGEDPGGDQEDLQYQEWLHPGGRGGGSSWEPMGIRIDEMKILVVFWGWYLLLCTLAKQLTSIILCFEVHFIQVVRPLNCR